MQKHIYFCSFFPIPKKLKKKDLYIYIYHAHPFKHGFVKCTIEGKILTWKMSHHQSRCSIVVSIPACHAGDPGSIPGSGDKHFFFALFYLFLLVWVFFCRKRVVIKQLCFAQWFSGNWSYERKRRGSQARKQRIFCCNKPSYIHFVNFEIWICGEEKRKEEKKADVKLEQLTNLLLQCTKKM